MTDPKQPVEAPSPSEPETHKPIVPDFLAFNPEVARAVDAVHHEMKQERQREASRALVELRQRLGGFRKRVVARVYVPQCEDCYAAERHQMEGEDSTWRPPDIQPRTWRKDLSEYASQQDIRRTYREMKAESEEFPLVRCDTCKQAITYWRDPVYVSGRLFESHFPELVGREDRDPPSNPPEYVRKLVHDAYAGRCAGCGVALAWGEKTMDHIRPQHLGGAGTLENIQLACEECNKMKGDDESQEVPVWLDFLLVAQGPEFQALARLAGL